MCISTPPTYTPMAGGTRLTVSGRRPIVSMFGAKTRFVIEGASPAPSARSPRLLPPRPPCPNPPKERLSHALQLGWSLPSPTGSCLRRGRRVGARPASAHHAGCCRRPKAGGRASPYRPTCRPPFPPRRISGVADSPAALGFPTIRPGWRAVHHFGHRGVRGVLHARREGRDNGGMPGQVL